MGSPDEDRAGLNTSWNGILIRTRKFRLVRERHACLNKDRCCSMKPFEHAHAQYCQRNKIIKICLSKVILPFKNFGKSSDEEKRRHKGPLRANAELVGLQHRVYCFTEALMKHGGIFFYIFEGSLEAKLPTIWRDGNGTAGPRKKLGRGESQKGEDKRWRKSEERDAGC